MTGISLFKCLKNNATTGETHTPRAMEFTNNA